jgi:hypothetical protein
MNSEDYPLSYQQIERAQSKDKSLMLEEHLTVALKPLFIK